MLLNERQTREELVLSAARAMMAAARTAPKGCGVDNLEIGVVSARELGELAESMRGIGEREGRDFFLRDAGNIENSQAVVLIGCKSGVRGLNCGMCGYPTCREKRDKAPCTPCSFDVTDLGIAVGAAVSIAADFRVDNRIMYSAGVAAGELGYLPGCTIIYAIPLCVSGKSIYFDREGKCRAR